MVAPPRSPHAVRSARRSIRLLTAALIAICALIATACGDRTDLVLTPEGAAGRTIANESGCAACHGKDGQGVTAPTWQGLYLGRVQLDGGVTVVADEDYLYQSITDPQSQIRRDYTLKMPTTDLSEAQIASIITYIKELS